MHNEYVIHDWSNKEINEGSTVIYGAPNSNEVEDAKATVIKIGEVSDDGEDLSIPVIILFKDGQKLTLVCHEGDRAYFSPLLPFTNDDLEVAE